MPEQWSLVLKYKTIDNILLKTIEKQGLKYIRKSSSVRKVYKLYIDVLFNLEY